jgi:hypothetical protein
MSYQLLSRWPETFINSGWHGQLACPWRRYTGGPAARATQKHKQPRLLIAAYREMLVSHPDRCSADRIIADPALRDEFLARVRTAGVAESEYDVLRTLHNLRKRSKLPRRDDAHAPAATV